MNHEMKRAVVATLLKAGRRDLAETFAANEITVTVTTERFNQSRSYTLRRRDLATVFAMIEKATAEIMEHFAA